jgi:CheY-like chemotaxis protein
MMSDQPPAPTFEVFVQWLRQALDNLYDTHAIQRNPLADLFGQEQMTRLLKGQNLRKVLLQCIQSLGETKLPNSSPDWLAYRILEMRYLDGLPVDEIAIELSISKSQFFRDQARAVNLLADIAWDRCQSLANLPADQMPPTEKNLAEAEAKRLSDQSTREMVDLDQLVEDLHSTLEMLGQPGFWKAGMRTKQNVLLPSANRVMLRQAVLILSGWAASRYPHGELSLETFRRSGSMGLALRVQVSGEASGDGAADDRSMDIAGELLASLGGKLNIAEQPGAWQASLEWSNAEPVVLVVDDDVDILALFRRYLTGYPWQVLAPANGAEAPKLIETIRPAVVMLDVMMPRVDGWELLAAIKNNPATRDIPVIVCSVLKSPALALNLGAAAYLPKPVSQQALIEALARWSQPSYTAAPGS